MSMALEALETTSALPIVVALTDARFQTRRFAIVGASKGDHTAGSHHLAENAGSFAIGWVSAGLGAAIDADVHLGGT